MENNLQFRTDEKTPGKITHFGEIWSIGWDIPTKWAIDEHGQCWMDNAHGHALEPVEQRVLLGEASGESDETVTKIYLALGRKPKAPSWARSALNAGWEPPKGFDRDAFDWDCS